MTLAHPGARHRLDRAVRLGDRARVGLFLDPEPVGPEEAQGDLVGAVGELVEEREPGCRIHQRGRAATGQSAGARVVSRTRRARSAAWSSRATGPGR